MKFHICSLQVLKEVCILIKVKMLAFPSVDLKFQVIFKKLLWFSLNLYLHVCSVAFWVLLIQMIHRFCCLHGFSVTQESSLISNTKSMLSVLTLKVWLKVSSLNSCISKGLAESARLGDETKCCNKKNFSQPLSWSDMLNTDVVNRWINSYKPKYLFLMNTSESVRKLCWEKRINKINLFFSFWNSSLQKY